jgi:hypothetical protein
LLGIPLLKLEATVVLVPARATTRSATPPRSALTRAPAGRRLGEALRSIDEAAALLAESRNGS